MCRQVLLSPGASSHNSLSPSPPFLFLHPDFWCGMKPSSGPGTAPKPLGPGCSRDPGTQPGIQPRAGLSLPEAKARGSWAEPSPPPGRRMSSEPIPGIVGASRDPEGIAGSLMLPMEPNLSSTSETQLVLTWVSEPKHDRNWHEEEMDGKAAGRGRGLANTFRAPCGLRPGRGQRQCLSVAVLGPMDLTYPPCTPHSMAWGQGPVTCHRAS